MKKMKTMIAALALSAMTLTSAASAHDGRRDRNPYGEQRRGADTGTVVAVGAAGLIIGAVIAGSRNDRRADRAYTEGYEDGRRDSYPRYERDYREGYRYGEYYYVPRGYYYRDRWYEDGGYGYRYYWNYRPRNYRR